ncbi:MAG: hypothetical protein KF712_05665 [Akkermansiaceae bacterium]|nr:hypothetical protein [Akkermansiaceae bacterium]
MKKEQEQAIIEALKLNELKQSLQDVIGRTPESVTFEFPKPESSTKGAQDELLAWEGNIYKYRFDWP